MPLSPPYRGEGRLARCRVVLVRPRIAANIGAVARAMANFGARQLCLVNPEAEPRRPPRAALTATHSADILQEAAIVPDLEAAVADCIMVIGSSARAGGLMRRQNVGSPLEILPHLLEPMQAHPVALVFGPEPNGLLNEEVTRCHYLLHIPTAEQAAALNLSHAAAICLYELRKLCTCEGAPPTVKEDLPPCAAQEHMFSQLAEALEAVHFLYGDKAAPLMHAAATPVGEGRDY